MPYSGTLTTILFSMEPAIAIVLACVQLMRSLFKGYNSREDRSISGYNTSDLGRSYTKKQGRGRNYSGNITELLEDDDEAHDNDSQIQLQLVDMSRASISTIMHNKQDLAVPDYSRAITVKRSYTIRLK